MVDSSVPTPTSASEGAKALAELSVNTIRTLAMDAVEKAKSGHPGTAMALAPLAYALWTRVLRYDAAHPDWPDRDRFVLSAGHASMLLYAMLFLTGEALTLEDLESFRQWGSRTAGHPEYGLVPGVETTTGPLGQGLANAVGMALAERMLAARVNRPGFDLVDHRTWVIAGDGDLMEGITQEAASLAGHLGLSRLCVFYDDNHITIDGETRITFTEDVGARFEALGWQVLRVGLEATIDDYVAAADAARAETEKPTLVMCRTHIGYGAPTKQDRPAAHGAPLGPEELAGAKRNLGWPEDAHFLVPPEVLDSMRDAGRRGREAYRAWTAKWADHASRHPAEAAEVERRLGGELPEGWDASLPSFEEAAAMATRKASGITLNAVAPAVPELVGGSADLAGSNLTTIHEGGWIAPRAFGGRNIHFGIREHAMGAILNGLALHGGFRPFGGTFLVFSDYLRPAIRMAALMKLPVVYVFTHDSIGVGEDGPTHQPVEHLAALRAIPRLQVVRPADGAETAQAWRMALETAGPTALILSRQALPQLSRAPGAYPSARGLREGAYALVPGGRDPDLCLLATGSEVHLALAAARILEAEGLDVRVVSFPCWKRFAARERAEQEALLGRGAARVGVEAGVSFGWHRWVGEAGGLVTLDRFGASAPGEVLMKALGFTPEHVVQVARETLARAGGGARAARP